MQTSTVFLICALAITICLVETRNLEKFDKFTKLFKLTETSDKDVPLFVKSLKKLHRAPPASPAKSRKEVETKWITQKLDHFDEAEERTWQMRYLKNDEFFEEGGPMFIMLGGEWEIKPDEISGGHFYDMAKEHKAMLYYTEHRYYGESEPTDDITVDNLKYLNVKQALADLAHFISTKRETEPALKNSKVIMAGGSYSATMVVWFKRLYPELLTGGWASSAPLLAKVDFREYEEVVGRAIKELGNQKCYNRIQNGIAEIESMFANNRAAEVKAMMKLCNNFNHENDLDLWTLFGTISSLFNDIVQYQDEGDVPFVCDYLDTFEDDVSAIAGFLLNYTDTSCVDVTYKSSLAYYMDSTFSGDPARPWYYQTCNEYGWYQSSGSRNQPFGSKFPVNLYTTLCNDIFGDKYTNEQINLFASQTNSEFGGMKPEVENVFMTQGGLDPWSAMGHGEQDGAFVIPRAAHCKDLHSIHDDDSDEMRAAKEKIADLVRKWLAA